MDCPNEEDFKEELEVIEKKKRTPKTPSILSLFGMFMYAPIFYIILAAATVVATGFRTALEAEAEEESAHDIMHGVTGKNQAAISFALCITVFTNGLTKLVKSGQPWMEAMVVGGIDIRFCLEASVALVMLGLAFVWESLSSVSYQVFFLVNTALLLLLVAAENLFVQSVLKGIKQKMTQAGLEEQLIEPAPNNV